MEIIFNEKPGEIYDIFQSLWVINNYDYIQDRKKSIDVKDVNEFEESLKCLRDENKLNMEKLEKYFYRDMEPKKVLILSNLWRYKTIEDYLEYIRNLGRNEVCNFIVQSINSINGGKGELTYEEIDVDLENMIYFIDSKEIDGRIKWEMLTLLNNREKYIKEFMEFIEEYLELYTILNEKRWMIMDNVNKKVREGLEKDGMEYLDKLVDGIFDFKGYENIYITTSVLSSLIIADEYSTDCFLILGPYLKGLKDKLNKEDEVEANLNLIKNLCEGTRFRIIKMLLERDYYGNEIAKELGLTKATISYHMDYLVTQKIAYIKKEGQKIYYSLNKDVLRMSVEFLEKEFQLME